MMVIVWIMATGRHGTEAIDLNLYLIHKCETESETGPDMGFLNLKVNSLYTRSPTTSHPLNLPEVFYQLGAKCSNTQV